MILTDLPTDILLRITYQLNQRDLFRLLLLGSRALKPVVYTRLYSDIYFLVVLQSHVMEFQLKPQSTVLPHNRSVVSGMYNLSKFIHSGFSHELKSYVKKMYIELVSYDSAVSAGLTSIWDKPSSLCIEETTSLKDNEKAVGNYMWLKAHLRLFDVHYSRLNKDLDKIDTKHFACWTEISFFVELIEQSYVHIAEAVMWYNVEPKWLSRDVVRLVGMVDPKHCKVSIFDYSRAFESPAPWGELLSSVKTLSVSSDYGDGKLAFDEVVEYLCTEANR